MSFRIVTAVRLRFNVSIINNRTRSNGILVQGSPSKNVTVKNNEHIGGGGSLHNKANASVLGEQRILSRGSQCGARLE